MVGYGGEDGEAGEMELPLRGDNNNNDNGAQASSSNAPASAGTQARAAVPPAADDGWFSRPGQMACDLVASIVFWYILLFVPVDQFNIGACVTLVLMVLYRAWRVYGRSASSSSEGGYQQSEEQLNAKVPYTCGAVVAGGRELFLVSTLHISPRAPKDVEAVIESTSPDVVMIELDEERLDRMRRVETTKETRSPRQEDLQLLKVSDPSQQDPITMYAQRALWNAEWAGQEISGEIVFDETDEFGLSSNKCEDLKGCIALVQRGGAEGQFAPFALKAHVAARAGAEAVLVMNQVGELPANRVGGGTLTGDLRTALTTCSCGFPPVPLLLLPHEDGTRLQEQIARGIESGLARPRASFRVLDDSYPRRTLRRRLCQGCALIFSGIGVLYGVIQCFSVEVGGEFLAAEMAATAARIPCVCIDVDLDRFWSRLGSAVLPTPSNLAQAMLAWLALPRVLFRLLFPPQGNIDVPGGMVLHAWSFPLRMWVAFILAGFCASFITTNILKLFTSGAETAAESSGAVHPETQEDREDIQAYIMLGIEMYMMPRVYEAVAASRDEAMYQSIVAKCKDHDSRRMVVVVGAGHANGILEKVRSRGL